CASTPGIVATGPDYW
nr:immunoglobulin heavy chain junction region [Macaca mulatta]MOY29081.1 immunoglobulin heavy chain junction region [Macaca mulatta]